MYELGTVCKMNQSFTQSIDYFLTVFSSLIEEYPIAFNMYIDFVSRLKFISVIPTWRNVSKFLQFTSISNEEIILLGILKIIF